MASILITILQLRSGEERSDPGLAVRVRRTTSITSLQLRSGGGGGGEKEEAHAGGTADIKSNTSQPVGNKYWSSSFVLATLSVSVVNGKR